MNKDKIKELVSYLFFGVMTTIVNFGVYFIADHLLGKDLYLVSNVIAWVAAVIFAYVTNKLWVFKSKSWAKDVIIKEAVSFVSARLFSLLLEELGLWLMVSVMNMACIKVVLFKYDTALLTITGDVIAKIITQFVVVVTNYFLSKLIIFRKKEE